MDTINPEALYFVEAQDWRFPLINAYEWQQKMQL